MQKSQDQVKHQEMLSIALGVLGLAIILFLIVCAMDADAQVKNDAPEFKNGNKISVNGGAWESHRTEPPVVHVEDGKPVVCWASSDGTVVCNESDGSITISGNEALDQQFVRDAEGDTETNSQFLKHVYDSTAILYQEEPVTSAYKMACTVTAIPSDDPEHTLFLTAAHCVCNSDLDDNTVSPDISYFFVSRDEKDTKDFAKAKILGCGFEGKGDDFALLQTKHIEIPTLKIGSDPGMGDKVVNVSSPFALGRQLFFGTVSSPVLDRPAIDKDNGLDWENAVMLQMFGIGPGSSGSAVVCVDQRAICSIIVGSINATAEISIPISRYRDFRKRLDTGTYKNWEPDPYAAKKADPKHK